MKKIFKKIKLNSFVKDGLLYTVGSILIKASAFITLPIFLRLLSVEEYGLIAVYTSWTSLVSIVVTLQIIYSIPSAKIKYSDIEFRGYLFNINLVLSVLYLLLAVIIFIFGDTLSQLLGLKIDYLYLMLIGFIFGNFIEQQMLIYQFESKATKRLLVSLLQTIFGTIFSIVTILYIWKDDGVFARIFGGLLFTIILGSYFFYKQSKLYIVKIKKVYIHFALSISLPLVFHNLAGYIINISDRIMVEKIVGLTEAGLYSFAYNIGLIINIVYASLNMAWVPWLFKNLKSKNYVEVNRLSRYYLIFGTICLIAFQLLTPELIQIMAPQSYWQANQIAPFIALAYFYSFLYAFPANYEFFKEKTSLLALGTILAALLNIILNLWLIPLYKGLGAAVTTLLAQVFVFIIHECLVRFVLKTKVMPIKLYVYSMLLTTITTLIYFKFYESFMYRLLLLLLLLSIIVIKELYVIKKGKKL